MPLNRLKINTLGPELPKTSTNRLQCIKNLPRDITECLHFPQIVPDFAHITRKRRQLVSNCPESPWKATQCLQSSHFTIHLTQINPNCLRIAPTRLESSEFHPKLQPTALNRLAWSQIHHHMSSNRRQTPQNVSSPHKMFRNQADLMQIIVECPSLIRKSLFYSFVTSQNVSTLTLMSLNQLQSAQNGLKSSKMPPSIQSPPLKFVVTHPLRYHSIS